MNKNNIKQLLQALKKNPSDSFAKFALALELLKSDEVSKARVLFESILEQDPGYLGVYYHLGKLYEQQQLFKKALELYQKGVELARQQGQSRTCSELEEAIEFLNSEMNHE